MAAAQQNEILLNVFVMFELNESFFGIQRPYFCLGSSQLEFTNEGEFYSIQERIYRLAKSIKRACSSIPLAIKAPEPNRGVNNKEATLKIKSDLDVLANGKTNAKTLSNIKSNAYNRQDKFYSQQHHFSLISSMQSMIISNNNNNKNSNIDTRRIRGINNYNKINKYQGGDFLSTLSSNFIKSFHFEIRQVL